MKVFLFSIVAITGMVLFAAQVANATTYRMGGRAPVMTKSGIAVQVQNGSNLLTKGMSSRDCHMRGSGKYSRAGISEPYYVFFDNNSDGLDEKSRMVVRQAYEEAMVKKVLKFKVSGHASAVGSDAYNMRISARRAANVKHEIERLSNGHADVVTAAFGDKIPFDRGSKRSSVRQDRRVEIRYVYAK